ncbi:MAG: ComEC/Rec2 family competence protein, partial [Chloroflexota bacterium]
MILVWLAGALVAGVVAGTHASVPAHAAVAAMALLLIFVLLLRHHRAWPVPLVLAALLLGLVRAPHHAAPGPSSLRYYTGHTDQLAGVVSAEPDIRDTGANYVLSTTSLVRGGHTMRVTGSLAVHTSRAVQLEYGDSIVLTGKLQAAGSYSAPSIDARMLFPRLIDNGPTSLAAGPSGWIAGVRAGVESALDSWLPEPEAALLIAITVGAHSASLGDLAPILVTTGLIHLVAISGIKVALVAAMLHRLVRPLGSRLLTLLVPLSALWMYVLLTGSTPSGVRSAVMWSLVFVAAYLGRSTLSLVSLSLAAAVMIVINPLLPWDLGFLLSMFGTFAIIAFAGPIQRYLRFIPSPWKETLAVTVAAQIATAPLVAVGFH